MDWQNIVKYDEEKPITLDEYGLRPYLEKIVPKLEKLSKIDSNKQMPQGMLDNILSGIMKMQKSIDELVN